MRLRVPVPISGDLRLSRLIVLILAVAAWTPAFSQMSAGRFAVMASLPQGPDVGISYAATGNLRINLGVGFLSANPDVGPARSEFTVRPGVWFVQKAVDNVSLCFGGALEFLAQSGGTSTGDVGLIAQAGAEYAVGRSFSVGTVVGLGYGSGDTSAFGAKGSRFGTTEAAVVLTWWVL